MGKSDEEIIKWAKQQRINSPIRISLHVISLAALLVGGYAGIELLVNYAKESDGNGFLSDEQKKTRYKLVAVSMVAYASSQIIVGKIK